RDDLSQIGIACQNSFGAGKYQRVDGGLRMSEFDAADERRRQQDVAQAPQDDDEHARITRQHRLAHCCTIEEEAETSSSADSADMPREAEIWVPSIVSCSRLRLVAS